MKEKLFNKDGFIIFDEAKHKYTDVNGKEYSPMTKCCSMTSEPFDAEKMSRLVAQSELGWNTATQEQIELYAAALRQEWIVNLKISQDWGTTIHKTIEHYEERLEEDLKLFDVLREIANRAKIEINLDNFSRMLIGIHKFYSEYFACYNEELIYDKVNVVSGTTDNVSIRQKKGTIVDFFDYKTNFTKGICFDSIKRNDDLTWKKHYNIYYKQPLDYLEKCNYTDYCLQLSGYGRMAENFGYKVGRLALIHINTNFDFNVIPVPYMRREAEVVLSLSPLKLVSTEVSNW